MRIPGRNVVNVRLPATFAAAFPDLYNSAYRAAFRLLGDRQEAEDVAQEACARACMRWTRLMRNGAPEPWVLRAATNLAADQYQRHRSTLAHSGYLPNSTDGRRILLHHALDQLSRRQRDVVVLRYVADLSEADTAAALGCATGTVQSHATRGLAALRTSLGEETTP